MNFEQVEFTIFLLEQVEKFINLHGTSVNKILKGAGRIYKKFTKFHGAFMNGM